MKFFRSAALITALLAISPAFAQWQVPNHSVPIGRGVGNTGFGNVAPGTSGLPFKSNGVSSDPSYGQIGNSAILPGAANTVKGSLNGSTLTDLPLPSCANDGVHSLVYVSGVGYQCEAISFPLIPIIASRTIAASLDLSAFSGITVQGYATPGDGGFMTMKKVGAQPFCANFSDTASFQDAAGNWWDIAEPTEYNVKQFGAKFDDATDDTAAIQSAIYCAALYPTPLSSITATGANGKIVRLPSGVALIGSQLIVPGGVVLKGNGVYETVLHMATGFAINKHMIILGEQFLQNDIALSQTAAGAGNLTLNGSRVRSGTAYTLYSAGPQLCSANNNSGTTFTFHGINAATGLADTDAIAGPTAGNCVSSTKGWVTITQISTNGAYTNLTAGYPQAPAFSARLEDLQVSAGNLNATQFSTFINCCGSSTTGTAGVSGNAIVYTNSVQHTGGLERVKIFAGNRSATIFEVGVGGASYFTYNDVETFGNGNCGGCASNNPSAYFNYGGLQGRLNNLVVQGPGASGGASVGLSISGGFLDIRGYHTEGIATAVDLNTTSVNTGTLTMMNVSGSASVTDLIKIEAGAASNITYLQGVYANGSTHTVNNKGVNTTGNVFTWTQF